MNAHRTLAAVLIGCALAAAPASAQVQVRGRAMTTVRYIQLRPLVFDSAADAFHGGERTHAAPVTQDLELSAWGFGVRGLRAYTLVRGRTYLGDAIIWPRSDDHFDALWGYLELNRDAYRVRLGRLQRASGLGFYAFDGGLATWRPMRTVRIEGYGGRALARGFLEPLNSDAIRSLDPHVPDAGGRIAGASVWAAPMRNSSVSALYQKVWLVNDGGTVSERAALDAQLGIGSRLTLRGSGDVDIAMGDWGKARLGAVLRLPKGASVDATWFRYKPTFDLTTIWGVFAPQSHHGFEGGLRLRPMRQLQVGVGYTYRTYLPSTETSPFDIGMDDQTHQVRVDAAYVEGDYRFTAAYRLSSGYGGWRSGGEGELAWDKGGLWHAGFYMTAFQSYEEFRVAEGTVFGVGGNVRAALRPWLAVRGSATQYFHTQTTYQAAPDWSQLRAEVGLDITFGANADRAGGAPR
jgi:hypothetical protein